MGKKSSGGSEAAAARLDEKLRQDRIRSGTTLINGIFDGGTYGTGALAPEAKYDPSLTYYKADGSVWTPDGKRPADKDFADMLKGAGLYTGTKTAEGFNNDFFSKRRQAFLDYATPQLNDQYGDAQKELTFSLARNGTLDSSVRGQKAGELRKLFDLNRQQIADQALASESEARTAVEDARSGLVATLNATGDATGAANSALARSAALSKPAAYSPLSNLFADFTAGLGTQAALEKANYYSGGQTGVRYHTGLFAPKTGSVKVG